MRRQGPPHPIPFNPARVQRDRRLRRAGFRVRMFAKFAPGALGFLAMLWFIAWLVSMAVRP